MFTLHSQNLNRPGPVFISYFTTGPHGRGYEEEVYGWLESVGEHAHLVASCEGLPTWRESVQLKPLFIAWAIDRLVEAKHTSAMWMDIDARLRGLITTGLPGDVWVRRRANRYGHEILGGTIILNFRNEPQLNRIEHMLAQWSKKVGPAYYSDQEALDGVLGDCEYYGLDVRYLSPEYCFIFDSDRQRYPNMEPVIEHMQKSRVRRNL